MINNPSCTRLRHPQNPFLKVSITEFILISFLKIILPQKKSERKEKGYKQLCDRISQRCWDLEAGRLLLLVSVNNSVSLKWMYSFTPRLWFHRQLSPPCPTADKRRKSCIICPGFLFSFPCSSSLSHLPAIDLCLLFLVPLLTHISSLKKQKKNPCFSSMGYFSTVWWTNLARAPLASVLWPTETDELEQHTSTPLQKWEKCAPCFLSLHCLTKVWLLLLLHLKDGRWLSPCFI